MATAREKALQWFTSLTYASQANVMSKHKDKILYGDKRPHTSLTGREIELLWNLEINNNE